MHLNEYGVVLFNTTSSAMKAEKVLEKAGLEIKLIPTPRQFSSDCGISLRFRWDDFNEVKSLLFSANVEINSIHQL
jgi:hypothetical protein